MWSDAQVTFAPCTWSAATTASCPGTRTTPPAPRWTTPRAGSPKRPRVRRPRWPGSTARSRSRPRTTTRPSRCSCRRTCGIRAIFTSNPVQRVRCHRPPLADRTLAFGKPVLLVNGDSHVYEADHPLASGDAHYGVTQAGAQPDPCDGAGLDHGAADRVAAPEGRSGEPGGLQLGAQPALTRGVGGLGRPPTAPPRNATRAGAGSGSACGVSGGQSPPSIRWRACGPAAPR